MDASQEEYQRSVWAVLTAAGSGTRLGADVPKALVESNRKTLLQLALERLLAVPTLAGVAVTCPEGQEEIFAQATTDPRVRFVAGGPSRQASVKAGLDALCRDAGADDIVLIHDAARCLAPTPLMVNLCEAIENGADAVIPGLEVADTIKQVEVDDQGAEWITVTPPRAFLRIAQTPQAFRWQPLWEAHDAALDRGKNEVHAATDDAALVEEFGTRVQVIPGSSLAFKVTTMDDLDRLNRILC